MQPESEEKIRAFIAIPVPLEIREELSVFQKTHGNTFPGVRWVYPDGFHITLKFLGEISPVQVETVRKVLKECVTAAPFEISFSNIGVFPNPKRARVLWVGFNTGGDTCGVLASWVDQRLEEFGFPREKRAFAAHLTIARFREPKPVSLVSIAASFKSSSFSARGLVLFQSRLNQSGAVYTPLESCYFSG